MPAHERAPARGTHIIDARQVDFRERAQIQSGAFGVDLPARTPDKPGQQQKIPCDAVGAGVACQVFFLTADRRRTGNISAGSSGELRKPRMSCPTNSGFSKRTACELPGTTAS